MASAAITMPSVSHLRPTYALDAWVRIAFVVQGIHITMSPTNTVTADMILATLASWEPGKKRMLHAAM